MKILITGGAGFVGSNLARYVKEHDPEGEVRIIDDLSTGRLDNLVGLDVEFTEGSILDYELLKSVTAGVDSVVHVAAIGSVPRSVAAPRPTHDANSTGTFNVLEAARELGVDHVVVASSSSVYGSNLSLPKSEFDWTRPMSPYAVSKQATEGYAIAYNFTYGMKTLALRFFNIFGPGQPADHAYAAVIPKFFDAALNDRVLTVHGDGLQSRDFTFVSTVCGAIYDAVVRKVHSQDPVNLAFGTSVTLLELIARMEVLLGRELPIEHVDSRVSDVRSSQSDGVRIRELFPDLAPVALDEGLSQTLAWFRKKLERV
jgi:UDP-glucose 4-epimerase